MKNLLLLFVVCALCVFPTRGAAADRAVSGQTATKAEQVYMAFLNGTATVTTSEHFRKTDLQSNPAGLPYGTYSYAELKAAVDGLEDHASTARYAFLDLGQDGINELALRFDSREPGLTNWGGIIRFNGERLELAYSYEDGGRNFSELYTSGYLHSEGAIGAGGYVTTLVGFDAKGFGTELFAEKTFSGIFARSVAYDLRKDGKGLADEYSDIGSMSQLIVREYLAKNTVKLSIRGWSKDSAVRAREQALIDELVRLGAELISEAEMERLCSLAPYKAEAVRWQDWNGAGSAAQKERKSAEPVVHVAYAPEVLLGQPEDFYSFIAEQSEYQAKVVFSTSVPVTNVRVLALQLESISDEGKATFSARERYTLAVLTPKKPLVITMVFAETIPNLGVAYVDGTGMERVYAIIQSGEDGKPVLTEATVKW